MTETGTSATSADGGGTARGADADPVSVTFRPTTLSTLVAVSAALFALAALEVATADTFLMGSAGVALVTAGLWVAWRWRRLVGVVVGFPGVALVLLAIAGSWTGVGRAVAFATVAPALLGALLVTVSLAPGRGEGTRTLLKAGCGVVFLGVLMAGVGQSATFDELALATVGIVVAYDAGETAVNVGEHLGQEASTWRVESTHLAGTAAVGVLTVLLGRALQGLQTPGLDLGQFAIVLVAVVAFVAVLHE
ncbi:DUF7519 family protein [Halorubellus litoreus]|uniref:Uncharacterized protein n=1 Tax=Halorubellus litoreus TaxID=755308 RepID=A0ABD5VMG0_9EURY